MKAGVWQWGWVLVFLGVAWLGRWRMVVGMSVEGESAEGAVEKKGKWGWLAKILDDLIRIPGTNKRVGLDPLLGLIPGVGDGVSAIAGLGLLWAGKKQQVPRSVYVRMGANWAMNAIIGVIPFVGDAFSFWYKSNRRNYALMKAYTDETVGDEGEKAGWFPVFFLLALVLGVFAMMGLLAWWAGSLIFG